MFNLYFAGSRQNNDEHILKRKANRLYSYVNERKSIEDLILNEDRGPLLVDSGAFSVAHNNAVVDIDAYIEYINSKPTIENFIELDVIPYPVLNIHTARDTAEKSWQNYLYMIERVTDWKKILPVFHFGEDLWFLRRMLEFEYKGEKIPFMCIGGRHGVSTKKQEKYFETVFKEIHNSPNPNIKVHVLGMTVLSALEKFPFYSADSTSHLQYAIYGGILTNYGVFNVSSGNNKMNNYRYFLPEEKAAILKYIEEMGYTLEELSNDVTKRIYFNIDHVLRWANSYQYKGYDDFKKVRGLF